LELLAESTDGVYAVDLRQRIVFWNRAAEQALGYQAEEVLGRQCPTFLTGISENGERVCVTNCAGVLLARKGKVTPSYTIQVSTKNGEHKWLSVVHVLLPGSRPQRTALVHIFREVSKEVESKLLVQQLRRLVPRLAHEPGAQETLPLQEQGADAEPLTLRELDVLRLLAKGMNTQAIASALVVTRTTARNHIQRILRKLGAHNRLEAVVVASRLSILVERPVGLSGARLMRAHHEN
jgi:PAS domain S-box-containing protein